jgi:hypothetical protein
MLELLKQFRKLILTKSGSWIIIENCLLATNTTLLLQTIKGTGTQFTEQGIKNPSIMGTPQQVLLPGLLELTLSGVAQEWTQEAI